MAIPPSEQNPNLSVQALAITTPKNAKPPVIRRTANFHPSIWSDQFITYTSNNIALVLHMEQQIEELKEIVKRELINMASKPSEQLKLIDEVQRLGVEYHFEREIEEALQGIYDTYNVYDDNNSSTEDLYIVSLWFRLLRQQGYTVSSDIFKKFKNDKDGLRESLIGDVKGMLSLYEATHLRVRGEEVLDEALVFTTIHLESMATQLVSNNPFKAQLIHALKHPIRKGLPRLEARHCISTYQEDASHNKALLKLAKLDFNLLHDLHKKELSDITRWWKELDFATKLPFVRDRIVEGYFWILGVYFEPQYSLARKILTQVLAMISVIDDIYDAYGTLEELELFTEAIMRWDINSMDQLPEYMKLCYQALLDAYVEVEEEMTKRGTTYRVHYAKEAFKNVVKTYFVVAKWCNEEYVLTMEEYMDNALQSCGYSMLTITAFVCMGQVVTKEAFDWVIKDPKIVRGASIICRLMDDMVGHKFEQKRGHVSSAVECYMKEHGVSKQDACDEFKKQVMDAWKDINQTFLKPTEIPMSLLIRVLNLARMMDVVYKGEDGYTHVGKEMKSRVALVLIDPVPI